MFGFPGVITPGNPNVCDQALWMPISNTTFGDIEDETVPLDRHAGMPANNRDAS